MNLLLLLLAFHAPRLARPTPAEHERQRLHVRHALFIQHTPRGRVKVMLDVGLVERFRWCRRQNLREGRR